MKKMMLYFALAAAALMVTAGLAGAEDAPMLSGTAYVAGHGGHLAVLNLANDDLDRIVITGPGGELEGKIAGLQLDPAHKGPGGGTHGAALIGRDLFVGLLNGKVMKYNLDTQKLTDLGQVGHKFCGAIPGPDGLIYYEDMADGHVYEFDPVKEKPVDVIPVGMSVCGIGWDKGDKDAFVSDMVQGKVFVLDWKTKKITDSIDVGSFIHQERTNPADTELWVTAPNEFVVGKNGPVPETVAGKGKSQIVIIDMATKKIKSRIDFTEEQAFPHDMAFTPDGKYVLVTCRTYSDDSIMLTLDAKTHKILKETSLCKRCHQAAGVKIAIDNGSPLLCGITVDWKK
jgi:DNA-binding beta-propeller fold protein YncE